MKLLQWIKGNKCNSPNVFLWALYSLVTSKCLLFCHQKRTVVGVSWDPDKGNFNNMLTVKHSVNEACDNMGRVLSLICLLCCSCVTAALLTQTQSWTLHCPAQYKQTNVRIYSIYTSSKVFKVCSVSLCLMNIHKGNIKPYSSALWGRKQQSDGLRFKAFRSAPLTRS